MTGAGSGSPTGGNETDAVGSGEGAAEAGGVVPVTYLAAEKGLPRGEMRVRPAEFASRTLSPAPAPSPETAIEGITPDPSSTQ